LSLRLYNEDSFIGAAQQKKDKPLLITRLLLRQQKRRKKNPESCWRYKHQVATFFLFSWQLDVNGAVKRRYNRSFVIHQQSHVTPIHWFG